MNDPFLSKDALWRKQIKNHAVDLSVRKKRLPADPLRLSETNRQDPNRTRVLTTRERILHEIAALDDRDIRLAASLAKASSRRAAMDVPVDIPKEVTQAEDYILSFPAPESSLLPRAPIHIEKKRKRKLPNILFGLVIMSMLIGGVWGYGIWQRASDIDAHIRKEGLSGYEALTRGKDAASEFSFIEAEEYFQEAYETFSDIIEEGSGIGVRTTAALSLLPFSLPGISQIHIVESASHLAEAGVKLSKAMRSLLPLPNSRDVLAARAYIREARALLAQAGEGIARIAREDIPVDFRSDFFGAYTALTHTDQSLSDIFTYGDNMLALLGHEVPRTYLVVFQDPAELRSTGGVIRSFATFTMFQGEVSDFKKENITVIDQQLTVNVIPPYPITLLSTAWSMHDANWFADFPTSAQKLIWFFEKSGGPSVDGVIALSLPEREAEELITAFTKNLTSMSYDEQIEFIDTLTYYLLRKDMLIYSRNTGMQEFIEKRGWSGRISVPATQEGTIQDVSAITYTNLSGNPMSHFIDTSEENITHIEGDGTVSRTVRITRTYRGDGESENARDYVRIYAPFGSRFVSAEGFSDIPDISPFNYEENGFSVDQDILTTRLGEIRDSTTGVDIFEENGMTVFGVWMDLALGERRSAELVYTLPVMLDGTQTYILSLFSQPGIAPIHTLTIEGGDGARISWCEDIAYDEQKAEYQYISTADTTVVCTLKKT